MDLLPQARKLREWLQQTDERIKSRLVPLLTPSAWEVLATPEPQDIAALDAEHEEAEALAPEPEAPEPEALAEEEEEEEEEEEDEEEDEE